MGLLMKITKYYYFHKYHGENVMICQIFVKLIYVFDMTSLLVSPEKVYVLSQSSRNHREFQSNAITEKIFHLYLSEKVYTSVVSGFPVCGILFCFSRKNEICKEYLGTGYCKLVLSRQLANSSFILFLFNS